MCDGDEIDRLKAINRDLLDALRACNIALPILVCPELVKMIRATLARAEAKP